MKLKLNENLPATLAEYLQGRGLDVHSVRDEDLVGAEDPSIAEVCQKEQGVLITLDVDFCDVRLYRPSRYCGIIVLRPPDQSWTAIVDLLPKALEQLHTESVYGRLWVVDERRTRTRE